MQSRHIGRYLVKKWLGQEIAEETNSAEEKNALDIKESLVVLPAEVETKGRRGGIKRSALSVSKPISEEERLRREGLQREKEGRIRVEHRQREEYRIRQQKEKERKIAEEEDHIRQHKEEEEEERKKAEEKVAAEEEKKKVKKALEKKRAALCLKKENIQRRLEESNEACVKRWGLIETRDEIPSWSSWSSSPPSAMVVEAQPAKKWGLMSID